MLAAAESIGDEIVAAMHTVMLAAVQYVQGDWPRGTSLLGRALECARAAGPSALMIRTPQLVVKPLIWTGNLEQARSYVESSLAHSRALRNEAVERAMLAALAELDLLDGQPEVALDRLQPLLTQEHTWEYVVSFFSTLAAVYLQLHDPERAGPQAEWAVAEARRTEGWVNGIQRSRYTEQSRPTSATTAPPGLLTTKAWIALRACPFHTAKPAFSTPTDCSSNSKETKDQARPSWPPP
jgi:hypothetical protein